ncbi:MAG TPA: hypothetical protein VFM32_08615, partial [Spongiibacteraceae bacterium]|nr:hypothetical protein [Spongiibacteraceae bacterium]
MPHPHSIFRIKFARLCLVVFTVSAMAAQGAEWRECEKAKLRELQLQGNSSSQKHSKRRSQRRDEGRRQRAEEIDTWLWKNCREF